MILDLYAGAGGWCQGGKMAGLSPIVGIDSWLDACRTAKAAGHPRICADLAAYPTEPFVGRVSGLVASPPCQAWSTAGKRLGEVDRLAVHHLVDAYAQGAPADAWQVMTWADARSHHAAQPMRWIHDLRPSWVCLEQVPPVLELWRHIGQVLRRWGYSVWCGILNAADYGVPQTRQRAILIARRNGPATPPEPTHARNPVPGLFGTRQRWVSMADALGWGPQERPSWTVSGGGTESGGGVEVFGAHARRMIQSAEADRVVLRNGNQARSCVRPVSQPAPTIHFGQSHNKVEWMLDRPATTGTGDDPDRAPPGHRDRAGGERQHTNSVKVSVTEAAILQGFPATYPWAGSNTSRYTQIGNAVPPPMAAHILDVAAGKPTTIRAAA